MGLTYRLANAAFIFSAPVRATPTHQNKTPKKQPNFPKTVYLSIEIKQKIRYDHRQPHL